MKSQLYICTHKDNGGDPFAVVATEETVFDLIADAVADLMDATVHRSTVDNGVVWAYCHEDVTGRFTIIAMPQREIYGLSEAVGVKGLAA